MEGMRQCNIRDCAAITKFYGWLENEFKTNSDSSLTEWDGARKVEEFRKEGELFKGPSFDTISSIGPNGAVIHYKPEKETALKLNNKELYLLDNGGQYLDGTTDITRTV
jgi:Xaa-Pro aminopeptidase